MDDADLTRRALAAYFRTAAGGEKGVYHGVPDRDSGVVEHDGKRYVVLRWADGVLAVYRVRGSGALRRMKRWPSEVADRNL